MVEEVLGRFLCRLYPLVCSKTDLEKKNYVAEGHRFEDETSEQLYYLALELGLEPNPPRMTLYMPSVSGNHHQFDASFTHGRTVYVIECKNTKVAAKDYIYYFNAKIIDYSLASRRDSDGITFRGIFLSTVPLVESAWLYALSYGIRVIDPESPPIEYMVETLGDNEALVSALKILLDRVNMVSPFKDSMSLEDTSRLLGEYRFLCTRWRDFQE